MTDQNALSTVIQNSQIQLAEFDNRLKNMIVNGKKLMPEERMALAQYAVATDLNPFVGECYFLPGIGPGPGIAGWRKKADEQLEWEASKARVPNARHWCDYLEPDPNEAKFDPAKGDIAVKAVLHDTLTRTTWEQRVLSHFIELTKAGMKDAMPIAKELAGPEPTWSAVAVVRGAENFGSSEKMDRYERACKRAEKAAIRKRFPRVHLPEPEHFDAVDAEDVGVSVRDITPDPTPEELIAQLGYEGFAESQAEPEPETPAIVYPDDLRAIVDSNGVRYVDKTDEELSNTTIGIGKGLANPKTTDEQRAGYEIKRNAIVDILRLRHPG